MGCQMPSYQGIAVDEQLSQVNSMFQTGGSAYTHAVSYDPASEGAVCPHIHDDHRIPAAAGVPDMRTLDLPLGGHSHHAEVAARLVEGHMTLGQHDRRDSHAPHPGQRRHIRKIGCRIHNRNVHFAAGPGSPRLGREGAGHSFAPGELSALDAEGMP